MPNTGSRRSPQRAISAEAFSSPSCRRCDRSTPVVSAGATGSSLPPVSLCRRRRRRRLCNDLAPQHPTRDADRCDAEHTAAQPSRRAGGRLVRREQFAVGVSGGRRDLGPRTHPPLRYGNPPADEGKGLRSAHGTCLRGLVNLVAIEAKACDVKLHRPSVASAHGSFPETGSSCEAENATIHYGSFKRLRESRDRFRWERT
jgi:hypothetical protein